MLNIIQRAWFKTISITLIATFLSLDVAWAYPDMGAGTSDLSPAALTQRGSAAMPVRLDIQIKGSLLTAAKYIYGDKKRGIDPMPTRNLLTLQAALRSELGSLADTFDILNATERPTDAGTIWLIPYAIGATRYVAQITPSDSPAAKELAGQRWDTDGDNIAIAVTEETPAVVKAKERLVSKLLKKAAPALMAGGIAIGLSSCGLNKTDISVAGREALSYEQPTIRAKAIKTLLDGLKNGDKDIRHQSLSEIKNAGYDILAKRTGYDIAVNREARRTGRFEKYVDPELEAAIPILKEMLNDQAYKEDQQDIVCALGYIGSGSDDVIRFIISLLRHGNHDLKGAALFSIVNFNIVSLNNIHHDIPVLNEAIPVINEMVEKSISDSDITHLDYMAIEVLGGIGQSAIPSLLNVLNRFQNISLIAGSEMALIGSVVEALEKIGYKDDEVIRILKVYLNKPLTSEIASAALIKLGDKSIETITVRRKNMQAMDPVEIDKRCEVLKSLHEAGDKTALIEMANYFDSNLLNNIIADKSYEWRTKPGNTFLRTATDEEKRHYIAIKLNEVSDIIGKIGDDSIAPQLQKGLLDMNSYVRRNAAKALGNLKSYASLKSLIKALNDSNAQVRMAGAEAIGKIGPAAKDAIPNLIATLNDVDNDVVSAAVAAIGNIGPASKDAIPSLVALYKKTEVIDIDTEIIRTLGKLGSPAVEALIGILSSKIKDNKYDFSEFYAAETLGDMGSAAKDAVPALRNALKNKSDRTRDAAAEAIKKIEAAIAQPKEELKVPGDDKKSSKLDHEPSQPMKGPKAAAIKAAMATALLASTAMPVAQLQGQETTPPGPQVTQTSPDEKVQLKVAPEEEKAIIEAASKLKEKSSGIYSQEPSYIAAKMAMIKFGASAVPEIIKMLNSENHKMVLAALEVLDEIGSAAEAAVPSLIIQLQHDRKTGGGHRVAMTLSRIGPGARDAVPALIDALKDKEDLTRVFSAMALGDIGSGARDALPALKEVLSDENGEVRNTAGEAIKKIEAARSKPKTSADDKRSSKLDQSVPSSEDIRAAELFNLIDRKKEESSKLAMNVKPEAITASLLLGTLFATARGARRKNEKLVIGIETSWVPGINDKGSQQKSAITSLLNEITGLEKRLAKLGLTNVKIVRGEGKALLDAVTKEKGSKEDLSNVVVLASQNTINSQFAPLSESISNQELKPLLASINPSELEKAYEDQKKHGATASEALYIPILSMITMALGLATGTQDPKDPMISSYDQKKRLVEFLPPARMMNIEELRNRYLGDRNALVSA